MGVVSEFSQGLLESALRGSQFLGVGFALGLALPPDERVLPLEWFAAGASIALSELPPI